MKQFTEKQIQTANELAALVVKAKDGEQAAFTELYDRTAPELYRCIRAMTRDEDLTWDIQQDSYLQAFERLDTLENNASFFPWLRRIAVNTTVTQMRKRMPLRFSDLGGDEESAIPELPDLNTDHQPELSLDRKETSRLVQEILASLPESQQLIVGMRYYDELSIKEIAETLKLSDGTVKSQLFQGRKRVESAVRGLEQQGIKLYGLSPLPFLLALMRQMEPVQSARQSVVKAVVTQTVTGAATQAVTTVAKPVTAATLGQLLHSSLGQLAIGALSVAAIGGGIWSGSKLLKRDKPIAPYQPTKAVEAALLDHSNSNDTPEDLIDPIAYMLPDETESAAATEPQEATKPAQTVEPTESTETAESTEPTAFEPDPDWPSGTCGENLTWYFNPNSGRLTIEGSGAMTSTPWGTNDSMHYSDILELSLPEGLTSISDEAFCWCRSLQSVTIPDSVTSIGSSAFGSCDAVKELTIGNQVKTIGEGAFHECQMSRLSIPASVSSIGVGAFSEDMSLTEIQVDPDNANYCSVDGMLLDKSQTNLLVAEKDRTFFTIPSSVTSIDSEAFSGCDKLVSITIPDSVVKIGSYAFVGCQSLTNIDLPANLTAIEWAAFDYCISLSNITIPSGVTVIEDRAFQDCCALTSLTFPDSVKSIGGQAFVSCRSLKNISIPGSVTSIGFMSFYECEALSSVTIHEGVTSIEAWAFVGCVSLNSLVIPDSVTSIGDNAFTNCTTLTEVTIPASVTKIGERAFGYYSIDGVEKIDGFTICGVAGSEAERYAQENGFNFIAIP